MIVAGVGPGNPKYLTVEVKEAIEEAEYVMAFGRVANSLKSIRDDFVEVNRVEDIIKRIDEWGDILILASGDPCFYGIVEFLKKRKVPIKKVLPGLSSFQYMMSKLEKSWQGACFLSLHGRTDGLEKVRENKQTIILTDKQNTPSVISKALHDLGVKGTIYAGFNLSYEDELIEKISIGEKIEDKSSLAVVIVENDMD